MTFCMLSLIVWSRGFLKNWDGGQSGNGGDWGDGVVEVEQVAELHCPVKSVIPATFDFKFVDIATT